MKRLLLTLVLLFLAPYTWGQSTTITGTVVDTDGQAWSQGYVSAVFIPPSGYQTPPVWSGGAFNANVTVTSQTSVGGAYSITLPSNTEIVPAGSRWELSAYSGTTADTTQTFTLTISGPTMTLNFTPPPVRVDAGTTHPVVAYTQAEAKAEYGQFFYKILDNHYYVCTASTGNGVCTNWVPLCEPGDVACGSAGTNVNWYLNGALIGTEPGGNVIQGANQTITAVDDAINHRVSYTFNAAGGGGGGGITPCSLGNTNGVGAPWQIENAGALDVNTFNGAWNVPTGWLPYVTGGSDLCSSLFFYNKGAGSTNPYIASGSFNNQTTIVYGPSLGFEAFRCAAFTPATSSLFPSSCTPQESGLFVAGKMQLSSTFSGSSCQISTITPFTDGAYNCTYADGSTSSLTKNLLRLRDTSGNQIDITPTKGGTSPNLFVNLPTCDATHEGLLRGVTNSTTNAWGATITGGGAFHVLGYCDGTNWTVAAL